MVLTTERFRSLTDQVAASLGLPQARIVEVPHPLGGTSVEVVKAWAEAAVDETLLKLTTNPQASL